MAQKAFKVGEFIPDTNYLVESTLGAGAAGSVYKCVDTKLNRLLAVKVLNSWSDDYPNLTAIKRLKREAKILCKLAHRNIVRIYGIGFIDKYLPYYSMEYLEGVSLRDYLESCGRLSCSEALQIASQIVTALDFAHSNAVLHRDLKPENIFLAKTENKDFQVKLIDFGLSKTDLKSTTLTDPGDLLGTVLYMSPEQWTARPTDGRSDIYSLGCILFEMLTGSVPYLANTAMEIMQQHLNAEIPKLETKEKSSIAIGALIEKCIQKNPANRYQTAKELLADLQKVQLEYTSNLNYLLPKEVELTTEEKKPRALILLGIFFSMGLIVASIWLTWHNSPSSRLLVLRSIAPTLKQDRLFEIQMDELPSLTKVSGSEAIEYIKAFTDKSLLSKLTWFQQIKILDQYRRYSQDRDDSLAFKLTLEELRLVCDFLTHVDPSSTSLGPPESKTIDETLDLFFNQAYNRQQWKLISAVIEKRSSLFKSGGRSFLLKLAELRADALLKAAEGSNELSVAETAGRHYLYALNQAFVSNPASAARIGEKVEELTARHTELAKTKFRLSLFRCLNFASCEKLPELRNEFSKTKQLANECSVSKAEIERMNALQELLIAKDRKLAWETFHTYMQEP